MSTAVVVAMTLDETGGVMVGTGIEVALQGWRRYPLSTVTLSPDFHEAADWLTARGGDSRKEMGGFGLFQPERVAQVLVDVGHKLYGLPFLEAVWNSRGRRKWEPRFRGVVAVEADIIAPQDDGARVKIGRSVLISCLAQSIRTGLIKVGRSEVALAKEWEAYNRGVGAGEKQAPPMVAALALAAWGATWFHRGMLADARGEAK